MKDDIQRLLEKASYASIYTSASDHPITPSRAGYPLLTQVLELLVLPNLPQPTSKPELANDISKQMSIAMGYVFEQTLPPLLSAHFPDATVIVEQPPLSYQGFVGTGDFIVLSKEKAVVIDAKCMNVKSRRDAVERKFTRDNWSYPTQLALYAMAASELYPSHDISAHWYFYSIPLRKVFNVELKAPDIVKLANAAVERRDTFDKVCTLLYAGNYSEAAALACSNPSELILPKDYLYGNLCGCTPFHYNPYAELFFYEVDDEGDHDGFPLEQELLQKVVTKLMQDSQSGTSLAYADYINEIFDNIS